MRRAMILAAGRGERLRPLTDATPKPLLQAGSEPLIGHHLKRLAAAGFTEIVINLAHLGAQIPAALGTGSRYGVRIQYSDEPDGALETAGGIRHALHLLGDEPFLLVNGDIYTDYPFELLRERPLTGLAHLILVPNPPHHPQGDFVLDPESRIQRGDTARLTYAGIGLYAPRMFSHLPPTRAPLAPLLYEGIAGQQISGERFTGLWVDVGTPERLDWVRDHAMGLRQNKE